MTRIRTRYALPRPSSRVHVFLEKGGERGPVHGSIDFCSLELLEAGVRPSRRLPSSNGAAPRLEPEHESMPSGCPSTSPPGHEIVDHLMVYLDIAYDIRTRLALRHWNQNRYLSSSNDSRMRHLSRSWPSDPGPWNMERRRNGSTECRLLI